MDIKQNINLTKKGFESSFLESDFYNRQTTDETHMELLIDMAVPKENDVILDLGTGSGYLAFPLAERYKNTKVIGLDIVENTLERNNTKANNMNINNLKFLSYDGVTFPFENNSVDIIITRYALHHFPNLTSSLGEMHRILKSGGKIIISDPTPNNNDRFHFVDKFMQMKPDGHIRFYYLHEYKEIMKQVGFNYYSNIMSEITFPRKNIHKYTDLLNETEDEILLGYNIKTEGDEIWITEKVLNMLFIKP